MHHVRIFDRSGRRRVEVLTFCYSFTLLFSPFHQSHTDEPNLTKIHHFIIMRSIATQTTITTTATTNTNTNTGNVFLRRLRCSSSDAHQSDKKTRTAARRNGPETTTTGASSEEEEEQQQQRRRGDDFADDDDANAKTKMMTSSTTRDFDCFRRSASVRGSAENVYFPCLCASFNAEPNDNDIENVRENGIERIFVRESKHRFHGVSRVIG